MTEKSNKDFASEFHKNHKPPIYEQDARKQGSYCPPPPHHEGTWVERCPNQTSLASNNSNKTKAELLKFERSNSDISIS